MDGENQKDTNPEDAEYIGDDEIEEIIELDDNEADENGKVESKDEAIGGDEDLDDDMNGLEVVDGGPTSEEDTDDSVSRFTQHKGPVFAVAIKPTVEKEKPKEKESAKPTKSSKPDATKPAATATTATTNASNDTKEDKKENEDDEIVLSGGGDDLAYLWKMKTGEVLYKLEGHTDSVIDVGFSFDGKFAATASMDGTIRIWTTADGKLARTLEGPTAELEWIQWHSRGYLIIAGGADKVVYCFDASTGDCRAWAGHEGPVHCGAFTHDGKVVCTGSEDSTAIIWNPKSGKPLFRMKGDLFHKGPITCLATHHDQRIMLTGSADASAKLTSVDTGKVVCDFKGHTDAVEVVRFCKTLKLVATGSMDSTAKIWDINTQALRCTLPHEDGITRLEWHPSEPLLYTASVDRIVRLWDARTGESVRMFKGHNNTILSLTVNRDGKTVVTGSDDEASLVFGVV